MRTAAICPTCATYQNAACIIYDGLYLSNLNVNPLDALDVILGKINTSLETFTGSGVPTAIPKYIGELYLDTTNDILYVGLSTVVANWAKVALTTTTTTTT